MSDNRLFWDRMYDKVRGFDADLRFQPEIVSFLESFISEWGQPSESATYDLILHILESLWSDSGKDPELFQELLIFEPILQRDEKYRDHFIHSLNVFLMGYYIMNKLNENTEINRIFRRSNDPNLTWMLASTFHDVAYPIQQIDYWINDLLKLLIGINPHVTIPIGHVMPQIYDHFVEQISKEHKFPLQGASDNSRGNIDWKFSNLINEKIYERDHGVYGGLILAHKLAVREGFYESGGYHGDFPINHLPACHAVCCHHLDILLNFQRHPYAFLLKICDEIQDWGRPGKKDREDILQIQEINITSGDIPIIDFTLNISEERKEELKQNLSSEFLKTNNKIRIEFSNQNRIVLHELN